MPISSAIPFCYATDVAGVLATDSAFRGRTSFVGSLADLLGHEALANWTVWISAVVTDTVEGRITLAVGDDVWCYDVTPDEISLIDEDC